MKQWSIDTQYFGQEVNGRSLPQRRTGDGVEGFSQPGPLGTERTEAEARTD